jgi:uncharacterized protein (UPF0210 family)
VNIRSITAFVEAACPLDSSAVAAAGEAVRAVREALVGEGLTVQTTRLAIQPFPLALGSEGPGRALDLAKDLQAISFVHEFDYIALGPVRLNDPTAYLEVLIDVFRDTDNVSASVEIASASVGLDLPRIRRMANLIKRAAILSDDGFANFRLGALANVGPWAPFFPAAYHGGGAARIALATESADLAVEAVDGALSLADARDRLIKAVEAQAARLEGAAQRSTGRFGVTFQGIDFSLAPFPDQARSIGQALEQLGLTALGEHGSLMAAAFIAETLSRARFTRTGFCGLMLPILEDSVLAHRAAEGKLSITELLTFSAVCGTGLDTIPLPGDVSEEVLSGILLDVAALALRLNKPLTARLLPLPGKHAGDRTDFAFEYFANSRVLAVKDGKLGGLLVGDERIDLQAK